MVATGDLKSPVFGRTGSSPVSRTKQLSVGKSGSIRLLWEQETEGSNPSTETIIDKQDRQDQIVFQNVSEQQNDQCCALS